MSAGDDDAGIVMPPPPAPRAALPGADPWGLASVEVLPAAEPAPDVPEQVQAVPFAPLGDAEGEYAPPTALDAPHVEPPVEPPAPSRRVVRAGAVGEEELESEDVFRRYEPPRETFGAAGPAPEAAAAPARARATSIRARWVVVGVLVALSATLAIVVGGRSRGTATVASEPVASTKAPAVDAPRPAVPPAGWTPAKDLGVPGARDVPAVPSAGPAPAQVATTPAPAQVATTPAPPQVVTPPAPAQVATPPALRVAGDAGAPVGARSRTVPGLPRQVPAWNPGNGLLVVRSDVPASVRVDGVDVGSTEGFVPIELPEGSYRVEVIAGGRRHVLDVRVEAGFPNPVSFRLGASAR